jgi:hypothetical protein
VREIPIGHEDLHPTSHVSFDVAGMDLSDKAVRSEVELGSEIRINLSPKMTRKAEEISTVVEDL